MELDDPLATLVGNLREEDHENPELIALLTQLVHILEDEPHSLPPEVVEKIKDIQDPKERFVAAAQMTGLMDDESLGNLARQLQALGLLRGSK